VYKAEGFLRAHKLRVTLRQFHSHTENKLAADGNKFKKKENVKEKQNSSTCQLKKIKEA